MGIIEKIIDKPVENLIRSNVGPPRGEVILLYYEYIKFANWLNWSHPDGTPW
jgi:hypothetical protein